MVIPLTKTEKEETGRVWEVYGLLGLPGQSAADWGNLNNGTFSYNCGG